MASHNKTKVYELSWYINPHMFWLRSPTLSDDIAHLEMRMNSYYRGEIQYKKYHKLAVGEVRTI